MENNSEVVSKVGHDLNKYLARIKAYHCLLLNRFEKNIVEKHGGWIWFETEENKGTTFTFRIPGTGYTHNIL